MTRHAETDLAGPAFDFNTQVAEPILRIPPLTVPVFGSPETTPLTVPLAAATVGLLVMCGAYYPDQQRLRELGDLSYRLLPRQRDLTEILIAHMTPVRAFALADPNVAYPRDTMLDLERAGIIGRYADNAVSMVGSVSQYEELATVTAPQIVEEFTAMDVDLLLVVPFCPQCHVSAGVLARAIEKRGLPTTSLTTLRRQAESLKPPRATFLDFPLGCPAGKPRKHDQQREIVRAALETGVAAPAQWSLRRLPFQWSEDGNRDWENLVADLYRVDNEIRRTTATNTAQNRSGLVGNEQEFSVRCGC